MKQKLLLILIFLVAMPSLSVLARDFTYTYQGKTLTYTVNGNICYVGINDSISGDVVIPSEAVDEAGKRYPVTEIMEDAFRGCTGITGITMSNTITKIRDRAFYECTGLTYAIIGNSVTKIGQSAFYCCFALKSVTIPSSVTDIGRGGFNSCTKLEEINISSVEAWCRIAFEDFSANPLYNGHNLKLNGVLVEDLVIPGAITELNRYAFEWATCLKSVTFHNSFNKVNWDVFFNCTELTEIRVPSLDAWLNIEFGNWASNPLQYAHNLKINGVLLENLVIPGYITKIKDYAFKGCSPMTSVSIPNSVTSIGNNAFEDCTGLTAVHISSLDSWFSIDFGSNTSNPLHYAHHLYLNGELLSTLVLPESVTEIKKYVLDGCQEINSITLPNSLTEISDNAFRGNTSLKSIIIPNSVTRIGMSAFAYCTELTSVTIPSSVTTICTAAFYGCTKLKEVYISSLESWCNIDFGINNANPIGYALKFYLNGSLVTDLVIPETVTEIKPYAFIACWALKSITISNSVTKIGCHAFSGCLGATSVTIPESVTEIGELAFCGCSSLTTIAIPESVTEIGESAFSHCKGLKSITLPPSITKVETGLFEQCENLSSIVIPEGVTLISNSAFYGCYGLFYVTLPSTLEYIGGDAFRGCYCLKSINFPESLTSINCTFSDCKNLQSVIIGSSVTEIAPYAFYGCTKINSVLCLAEEPPVVSFNSFDPTVYTNASLSVIEASDSAYNAHPVWSLFNAEVVNFVSSLTIDIRRWQGYEGQSFTITPHVLPENSFDKTVTWTSDNEDIATVDSLGVVTAVSPGTAFITGKISTFKAICTVVVSPKPIEADEVHLNMDEVDMVETDIVQLTATISPDDTADKSITWSSSDPSVASVNSNGKVTAVKAGTATITATTANGLTATCTVTVAVKIIYPTRLLINAAEINMLEDETAWLIATVVPTNATDKTVTWVSSEPSVATVDESGNVKALKAGTAVVTASTFNGVTATCTITVAAPVVEVTALSLNMAETELFEDDAVQLIATIEPEDATDKTVTWESSEPSVATVDDNGNVTAIGAGTTIITATSSNGITATCTVEVNTKTVEVTGLTLNAEEVELPEDETMQLTATIEPDNATDNTVTWESSEPSVASVDETGNVTAIALGSAIITASTTNGLTATCTVTVVEKVTESPGITLNMEEVELPVDDEVQLEATIHLDDETEITLTWSSSAPSVARVDENVRVIAVNEGTAIITASASNGMTASCTVTVTAQTTGIDNVEYESDGPVRVENGNIIAPEGSEVYDFGGVRVGMNNLSPGIYIVRVPGAKPVKLVIR